MNPIQVIGLGMGRKDLTLFHMEQILNSTILVGGTRQLAMFPEYKGHKRTIDRQIAELILFLKQKMAQERIVVLASGDPMFHGIGATLARVFPLEHLRIFPNISSIAAAFSAIGQPWHDAKLISLHSETEEPFAFSTLANAPKAAFLTSQARDPGYIAKKVAQEGLTGFSFCVLENLGDPAQKISWFNTPQELFQVRFSHPNLVVLIRTTDAPQNHSVPHETHFGMPDQSFVHEKGLITKSEIRAISLAKLRLSRKDLILWDIGSGSGSVGIEAALVLDRGQVCAVEKNPDRILDIQANCQRYQLTNCSIHQTDFPHGHENLPSPDRIFIGGGGTGLTRIIETAWAALKPGGTMVINCVVVETMAQAMTTLSTLDGSPEAVLAQIGRSKAMPGGNRIQALNPVWIISGTKPN